MRAWHRSNAQRLTALIALTLIVLAAGTATATEGVSPGALDRLAVVETRCPTFSWDSEAGSVKNELVAYELPPAADAACDDENDRALTGSCSTNTTSSLVVKSLDAKRWGDGQFAATWECTFKNNHAIDPQTGYARILLHTGAVSHGDSTAAASPSRPMAR